MKNFKRKISLGIDLSLNGTGLCVVDKDNILFEECVILNSNKSNKSKGMARITIISSKILEVLGTYKPDLVTIEGYSFGSRGRSLFDLGELGGVIKWLLYSMDIKYLDVPPKTLKKLITGNGNASKEEMMEAVKIAYKKEFTDNNICDAFALAIMRLTLGDSIVSKQKESKKNK